MGGRMAVVLITTNLSLLCYNEVEEEGSMRWSVLVDVS
jgi:hypothetical protein